MLMGTATLRLDGELLWPGNALALSEFAMH
jgi:hypothetical protein